MFDRDAFSETITHPLLRELFGYWERIKRDKTIPARTDFEPLDIPRILPHLVLLDVERDPLRFRVRVDGTQVVALRGKDITGLILEGAKTSRIHSVTDKANERMVRDPKPMFVTGSYPDFATDRNGTFHRLALPFSANGRDVDKILIGFIRTYDNREDARNELRARLELGTGQ